MKRFFISIVIANLLMASWLLWKQFAVSSQPNQTEPTLILVSEQQQPQDVIVQNQQMLVDPLSEKDNGEQINCYIIGPINTAETLQDIETIFNNNPELIKAKKQSQSKEALGYRVFIPKQESMESALVLAQQLAAKGIQDYYVAAVGEDAGTISLGVYSNEENAKRRQVTIMELGFDTVTAPHTRTRNVHFLTLQLNNQQLDMLPSEIPSVKTDCTL